jgi:hypothetical protein
VKCDGTWRGKEKIFVFGFFWFFVDLIFLFLVFSIVYAEDSKLGLIMSVSSHLLRVSVLLLRSTFPSAEREGGCFQRGSLGFTARFQKPDGWKV